MQFPQAGEWVRTIEDHTPSMFLRQMALSREVPIVAATREGEAPVITPPDPNLTVRLIVSTLIPKRKVSY